MLLSIPAVRLLPLVALVASVAGTAAIAGEGCTPRSSGAMPADDRLRAQYAEHAADFDTLRAMILAERDVQTVGEASVGECWAEAGRWTCPGRGEADLDAVLRDAGLERARFDRYVSLLHAVGGFRVTKKSQGSVAIAVSAASPGAAAKELVWSADAPYPLVADTDVRRTVQYYVSYAQLRDGWYIARTN